MSKQATAIILAAGQGKRMNASCNKAYLHLLGKPVLAHTLAVFEHSPAISDCIIVARSEECAYCQKEIVDAFQLHKVRAIVPGGNERQDSVYQGLLALDSHCQWVAIHDGARPLITADLLQQIIESVTAHCGLALAVPVKDTIKRTDSQGFVIETPPRASLWSVQTPQVFAKDTLLAAYKSALNDGFYGTDDASLIEHAGGQVRLMMGSYDNIKLTTPEDLPLAETILRKRANTQKKER